jgi:hypothetical protein
MNTIKLILVSLGLLALTACITPAILIPLPGVNCANDRGTEEKYRLPACADLEYKPRRRANPSDEYTSALVISGEEID